MNKSGDTYRVRAMPKTTETHRPGAWSEYVTYVG